MWLSVAVVRGFRKWFRGLGCRERLNWEAAQRQLFGALATLLPKVWVGVLCWRFHRLPEQGMAIYMQSS